MEEGERGKKTDPKHLPWCRGWEVPGFPWIMIKRTWRLLWKGAQVNGEGIQKSPRGLTYCLLWPDLSQQPNFLASLFTVTDFYSSLFLVQSMGSGGRQANVLDLPPNSCVTLGNYLTFLCLSVLCSETVLYLWEMWRAEISAWHIVEG